MAQTINIQKLFDQRYRDESIPFPIDGTVTGGPTVFNVADNGAVGNGVANDWQALQAAINAAQAVGGVVWSAPGKTYLCASTLNVTGACWFEFNGSTIKKAATMTQTVFTVSGNNVTMRDVVVDGNRSGGATAGGFYWTGTNGIVIRCTASHNWASGFQFDTTSGTVSVYDSVASDNAGSGAADGFRVSTGQMLLYGTNKADSNERTGFEFDTTTDGCRLEGRGYQNAFSAATIHCNKGYCPSLIAEQNNQYGLFMGFGSGGNGWTFDYVETNNTGVAIPGHGQNNAGTGIEMFGVDHNNFGTVISKTNLGYGIALATDGTNGSTYNTFHTVTCDQTGAPDGDPGIDISGASSNNTFGTAVIRGHTTGVNIGDGTTSSDSNVFGTLFVSNCGNGAITFAGGQRNSCQNLISRNTSTFDLTLNGKGIVAFNTALSTLNVIGFLDHDDTATSHATVPQYLAYADANAVNNTILDGFARASRAGPADLNGGNFLYLRRPMRRQQISSFDSGETWTNSTNNTTNGQFVEGNGGKKVTGGPSFTLSARTGLSLNLSAMATTDWFRMFAYITNQADFSNVSGVVQIRFVTSGGNYFTTDWDARALVNGGQWLSARKGAFASVGTPNWASITEIDMLVFSSTSIATVTFDDLAWLYNKWDRTSTIGQNNTPANITVAASPFVYQNVDGCPLNVMVSGGTVSAIAYSQDNVTYYSQGQIAGIFVVNPGDYTKVTYSVAPTMSKVPTR